ncbi:hypothetical protein AB0C34_17985 [Nocardia sp. NPDC049220]|uniref:hypothetical protein n=1 Tax=Nocardia sp. NPDC049220 TaxID=3155273 RepID=UPI0033C36358
MELEEGALVTIGRSGQSIFKVISLEVEDSPDHVMIQAVGDESPGRYPYPCLKTDLFPSNPE